MQNKAVYANRHNGSLQRRHFGVSRIGKFFTLFLSRASPVMSILAYESSALLIWPHTIMHQANWLPHAVKPISVGDMPSFWILKIAVD